MNNEEFAKKLISKLYNKDYSSWEEEIKEFLQRNNLKVINTKDQLLGYCVEDVIDNYSQHLEYFQKKYKMNIPAKLTKEQSQYLLKLADRINSKHDLGFTWYDIYEAIEQWLEETYVR